MKSRSVGGRDGPRFGAHAVEHALLAAGLAVATIVVVSADGGSLHSVLAGLRGHLLALLGG